MLRNSEKGYGIPHILLHWTMAAGVLAMFGLGLYMVDLGYYDPWYHQAPALHKSIGLSLVGLLGLRLVCRVNNPPPRPLGARIWLRRSAALVHGFLYLALILVFASGYLIAGADGRAVPVFELFSVPGLKLPLENQEDLAGSLHQFLAWALILTIAVHALAALKHHFIDRDATLKRMLWPRVDL